MDIDFIQYQLITVIILTDEMSVNKNTIVIIISEGEKNMLTRVIFSTCTSEVVARLCHQKGSGNRLNLEEEAWNILHVTINLTDALNQG